MRVTAREDYGIRAVVDIALNRSNAPIQARDISVRQGIPEQFLEQVLSALRRAGVVKSIRGASGGYDLARSADQITVGDVLRALSGPLLPDMPFSVNGGTGADFFWSRLRDAVEDVADGTTVQDLVDYELSSEQVHSYMMHI